MDLKEITFIIATVSIQLNKHLFKFIFWAFQYNIEYYLLFRNTFYRHIAIFQFAQNLQTCIEVFEFANWKNKWFQEYDVLETALTHR